MAIVVTGISTRSGSRPHLPRPPAEVLRITARRVAEELSLIRDMTDESLGLIGAPPRVVRVVREASLIHLLRLHHFFYGRGAQGDPVLAEDFFPDPSLWRSMRPDLPESFQRAWRQLIGYLDPDSLLSWSRRAPRRIGSCRELVETLLQVSEVFLAALPDRRAHWFVDRDRRVRARDAVRETPSPLAPLNEAV